VQGFDQYYQSLRGQRPKLDNYLYESARPLILTSIVGSAFAREIAENSLARELGGSVSIEELYRQSGRIISTAGFDAVPGTSLVIYSALKSIGDKEVKPMSFFLCNEAKFQKLIRSSRLIEQSAPSAGTLVFSAGERLFARYWGAAC
jgi:hypothetical protein